MRPAHRPEPEFGTEPLELGAGAVNPGGTGPGRGRWTLGLPTGQCLHVVKDKLQTNKQILISIL